MVGVREFYSASEAWTALSYSTRERQESEKVEDSERERERELEVGTQARNGGGGLGSGWEREASWWEKDGSGGFMGAR